jgi:hypothetical protein
MRDLLTDWAHQSFTERQRETQEAVFFFYLPTPVEEGGRPSRFRRGGNTGGDG